MYLLFSAKNDRLSLESRFVEAVTPKVHLHFLPNGNSNFLGFVKREKETVPVIDFTLYFTHKPSENAFLTRLIFLEDRGKKLALIAEKVNDTKTFESKELLAPPPYAPNFSFIEGVWMEESTPIYKISVEKLFDLLV